MSSSSDGLPSLPPFDPALLRKALGTSTQDAAGVPLSQRVQSCPICLGKGHLKTVGKDSAGYPQVFMTPCKCVRIERFKQRVGHDIFQAPNLKRTPLLAKTGKNLFLHADREDLLPHLKCLLWAKGPDFFFRLLTDLDVMDAWLSKPKESMTPNRDVINSSSTLGMGVAWSSLRDAVEDPSLLLLYIGVSTHPNRALSNALTEALRIRSWAGKPTWVINPPERIWREGFHICWSPELDALLQQHFETARLADLTAQPSARKRTQQMAHQSMLSSLQAPPPAPTPLPPVRAGLGDGLVGPDGEPCAPEPELMGEDAPSPEPSSPEPPSEPPSEPRAQRSPVLKGGLGSYFGGGR